MTQEAVQRILLAGLESWKKVKKSSPEGSLLSVYTRVSPGVRPWSKAMVSTGGSPSVYQNVVVFAGLFATPRPTDEDGGVLLEATSVGGRPASSLSLLSTKEVRSDSIFVDGGLCTGFLRKSLATSSMSKIFEALQHGVAFSRRTKTA